MADRPPGLAERFGFLLQWAARDVLAVEGAVFITDDGLERLVGARVISVPRGADRSPAVWDEEAVRRVADRDSAVLLRRPDGGEPLGSAGPGEVVCVAAPLRSSDGLLAVLRLDFGHRAEVGEWILERVALVADQLTPVLESAWLGHQHEARVAELERSNADLRELERLQGDFLSMVSHELRTPLTAIIGYTDLLLRQAHGPLNERQSRHGEAVKKAAHRLLGLINDLLDVTRLESRQVELAIAPLPLAEAFSRALGEAEAAAEQRQIELRLDVPTSLPIVLADGERLNQILENLLDNAIKFTPAGGRVILRSERRDGQAHVCVEDTGVGVPPEQLEIIWSRFHQVDSSTRRRFGGTGLGLAIVRNLVALHQGSVDASSGESGAGSRFCFSIPMAPAAPASPQAVVTPPVAPRERLEQERRILVVDDEPDNRALIASIITDILGHRAWLAADGTDALRQARDEPDLILLDLRMPGLSGFEVARALKSDPRTADIPLVALTALAAEGDRESALAAGCTGWVTKPFSSAELAAAIRGALAPSESVGATH